MCPSPRPEIIGTARAAGGEDRRQQQAHLVADAAGRVLVQHRPGESGGAPVEHVAGAGHRAGQRDALGGAHPAPDDRHRQRADLRVGDGPVGDPGHQLGDLAARQLAAVALAPDQLGDQHRQAGDEVQQQPGQVAGAVLRGAQRLLVAERLVAHALGEVGDHRDRGDAQAAVAGEDRLLDGRHADRVGAQHPVGADLGRRLEARAAHRQVHALGQRDPGRSGGRAQASSSAGS